MAAVSLKTPADIQAAIRTLGLQADDLKPKALDKLKPSETADPALAKALKEALSDFKKSELKDLRRTLGEPSTGSTTGSNGAGPRTAVGGAGVMPFNVAARLDGPKLTTNTPEVAAFLAIYGGGKVDRPLERVYVHAAKVQTMLMGEPDVNKLVDRIMEKDIRRHVFLLEGIGKLYKDEYKKQAPAAQTKAKQLEDLLGAYSAARGAIKTAEKFQAPQAIKDHMKKVEGEVRQELTALVQKEWMPNAKGEVPALRSLVDGWGQSKWSSYANDRAFVREEIADRIDDLHKDIEGGVYDLNMLQGDTGIHEVRRQLRWIPIYTEAVNGLVQLDETKNPVPAYTSMLQDPMASSKYVQLPDASRDPGAIQLSKSLYTALMKFAVDLGAVKDVGEEIEAIQHAYFDAGLAATPEEAHKKALELTGGAAAEAKVFVDAKAMVADLRANKLLPALRDGFLNG